MARPDGRSHKLGEVLAGLGSDRQDRRPACGHGCGRVAAPRMRFATVALLSLAVLASGLALGGSA
ncbi:MAG: hypothetical protein ACRDL0_01455 [Thermoleophilaceae bacterium]